jgi:hypothetical protein
MEDKLDSWLRDFPYQAAKHKISKLESELSWWSNVVTRHEELDFGTQQRLPLGTGAPGPTPRGSDPACSSLGLP